MMEFDANFVMSSHMRSAGGWETKISIDSTFSWAHSLNPNANCIKGKDPCSDDASGSSRLHQESMKSGSSSQLPQAGNDILNKNPSSPNTKMTELLKLNKKALRKQEAKQSLGTKQSKKIRNPVLVSAPTKQALNHGHSNSWICKNSACRAMLSAKDTFCKRCSCCICHLYDDNKDPSLWLVCAADSGTGGEYCGLSCHIECALQKQKVGIVDIGQLMQLDANYCCTSCGKVSGILECWKRQLNIAKDARRLDVLCHRIYMSYRLLEGTSRFKDLHGIVIDAKAKLEAETGPLNGDSVDMARGLVSRLCIANDVQKLCHLAIMKANELLAINASNANPDHRDSLPAACRFIFEEITPSSVKIILTDLPGAECDDIKGYKLWYYKSREEKPTKEPVCIFPKSQRRILISKLQPCTEYAFRILSYTNTGDLGHSEVKCFTKSIEITLMNRQKGNNNHIEGSSSRTSREEESPVPSIKEEDLASGFKIRDLGKILHFAWAGEQERTKGFCNADTGICHESSNVVKPKNQESSDLPTKICGLDLNVSSVPDLNETFTPPSDSSRDEDDAASHGTKNVDIVRCNIHDDSKMLIQTPAANPPVVETPAHMLRRHTMSPKEEAPGSDSTLMTNGSPDDPVGLDNKTFNYCVRVIRWLECEGYLSPDFRLKLLSWFSLRSSVQEQKVVNTFVQTLIDDPSSLAGQLVDAFSDIIARKRQRTAF